MEQDEELRIGGFGEEDEQEHSRSGGGGLSVTGGDLTNKLPLLLLGADLGGGARADRECYQEIEGGGWMVRIPFADEPVEESGLRFRIFSATSELLFGKGGRMEGEEEEVVVLREEGGEVAEPPQLESNGVGEGEGEGEEEGESLPWWRRRGDGRRGSRRGRGRRKKIAPPILRRRLDCQEFYDLSSWLTSFSLLSSSFLFLSFPFHLARLKSLSSYSSSSFFLFFLFFFRLSLLLLFLFLFFFFSFFY
jgi:hypothetical protein